MVNLHRSTDLSEWLDQGNGARKQNNYPKS